MPGAYEDLPRVAVFAGSALLMTACVPVPHRLCHAPEISGIVLDDGVPVQGAEIRLSAGPDRSQPVVLTNRDGSFEVGPISELRVFLPTFGNRFYFYTLEIEVSGDRYTDEDYGRGFGCGNTVLTCDLSPTSRPSSNVCWPDAIIPIDPNAAPHDGFGSD